MDESSLSPARERVLQAAEQLFSERGYTAVTLRDIADALHMKVASLYNHAPGGKEELFVAVTGRGLHRHQQGITTAAQAADDVRGRLLEVARWLLAHPPLHLSRMRDSDMPALSREHAEQLSQLAYESVIVPIRSIFEQGLLQGEVQGAPDLATGIFLTAMDTIRAAAFYREQSIEQASAEVIDMLLDGFRPR